MIFGTPWDWSVYRACQSVLVIGLFAAYTANIVHLKDVSWSRSRWRFSVRPVFFSVFFLSPSMCLFIYVSLEMRKTITDRFSNRLCRTIKRARNRWRRKNVTWRNRLFLWNWCCGNWEWCWLHLWRLTAAVGQTTSVLVDRGWTVRCVAPNHSMVSDNWMRSTGFLLMVGRLCSVGLCPYVKWSCRRDYVFEQISDMIWICASLGL